MKEYKITDARQNLYGIINDVNTIYELIRIYNSKDGAIIISSKDWDLINETLYLNSIPGMTESILKGQTIHIIKILMINPFDEKYKYETSRGNLEGLYSRRINFMHRIVYQVYEYDKIVKIIRIRIYYDGI